MSRETAERKTNEGSPTPTEAMARVTVFLALRTIPSFPTSSRPKA